MGDEKNRPDGPGAEVVVQDKKIRGSIFEDGALHFGVSGVANLGTERFGLAFQLERRFAGGAEVVDGGGVARGNVEPGRFAGGAEEIRGTPGFGADAGALGGAFVGAEAGGGKM